MIDQIGGWTTAGVGQTYGTGHMLSILSVYLEKCCGSFNVINEDKHTNYSNLNDRFFLVPPV